MDALAGFKGFAFFVDLLIKSTLALLLALLLSLLLRRRSAALRHFALSLFLIVPILFPLLAGLPSGWQTRWLPSWTSAAPPEPAAKFSLASEAAVELRSPVEALALGSPEPAAKRPAQGVPFQPISEDRWSPLPGAVIPYLWMTGALLILFRLALGLLAASRLSSEGIALEDQAWKRLLERFLSMISMKRRVRLKSHEKVIVPLTWGVVKPVIIMPAQSRDWTEDQRSSALFHELSHIKRVDFLVMLLVRASLALYWFNPLVWVVFQNLKKEQEKACDELVLRTGIKPSVYAETLLAIRRSSGVRWHPSLALLGIVGKSPLSDRLVAILKQTLTFKEVRMRTKVILVCAVVFVVSLIGLARPSKPAPVVEAVPVALAAASAAAVSASPAATVTAAQEQEQPAKAAEQEKKKDQAEKEKVIIIKARKDDKAPLEITIIEGDQAKTLVLDHAIALTKAGEKEGEGIIVLSEGETLVIKKGDKVRWTVKGAEVKEINKEEIAKLIKEGHALKIDEGLKVLTPEGTKLTVIKKKGGEPVLKIEEGLEVLPPEGTKVKIIKKGEGPAEAVTVVEVKPGEKESARVIVEKELRPGVQIVTVRNEELRKALEEIKEQLKALEEQKPALEEALAQSRKLIEEVQDKALQERMKALSDRLKEKLDVTARVQARVLASLAERLAAMSERLAAKAEHIAKLGVEIDEQPLKFAIVTTEKGEKLKKAIRVEEGLKKDQVIVSVKTDGGVWSVVYVVGEEGISKEAYERAVGAVKNALPEGYALEPKLGEHSKTISLKITAPAEPQDKKQTEAVLKKVIDAIKGALKKEPAAKD